MPWMKEKAATHTGRAKEKSRDTHTRQSKSLEAHDLDSRLWPSKKCISDQNRPKVDIQRHAASEGKENKWQMSFGRGSICSVTLVE